MVNVVLVFDRDCPNVDEARANVRAALETAGLSAAWSEWERSDPRAPAEVRELGSPTVLVDGHPIGGPSNGECCRVYEVGDHLARAPSVDAIVAALRTSG